MSFYPERVQVEAKPNSRVAVQFAYMGDGVLSNPSSSCSCTTPTINGNNIQMYINVGSWGRGVHTKYVYVYVDKVQHMLPVEILIT